MTVILGHPKPVTDQQRDADCNEGCTDRDEGGALPGAPNCQKDDADDEEHGAWRPGSRRGAAWSVGHAPNGSRLSGRRKPVRCSRGLGRATNDLVEHRLEIDQHGAPLECRCHIEVYPAAAEAPVNVTMNVGTHTAILYDVSERGAAGR